LKHLYFVILCRKLK